MWFTLLNPLQLQRPFEIGSTLVSLTFVRKKLKFKHVEKLTPVYKTRAE